MRLIDADELLNRLKGVAYTAHVKNVIHGIIEQSHTKQPNKLGEITRDEGLRCMLIGLINRMERIEKQVYDEIPERLKELRGERD